MKYQTNLLQIISLFMTYSEDIFRSIKVEENLRPAWEKVIYTSCVLPGACRLRERLERPPLITRRAGGGAHDASPFSSSDRSLRAAASGDRDLTTNQYKCSLHTQGRL